MNFFHFVIVIQHLSRILKNEYMYSVYVSFSKAPSTKNEINV